MARLIFIIVSASLTAMAMPKLYSKNPELFHNALGVGEQNEQPAVRNVRTESSSTVNPLAGRQVHLQMDERGHFISEFKLNGRRIEAMVDTGATYVAMNAKTARRIGIHLLASDYKYAINTANGQVKAATARIDEMRIGRIRVTDVEAAILPDRALDGVLVGMSFLKQLDRFQIEGNTLILQQ